MKTGRNELCPCGSGKKFKKCCLNKSKIDESPHLPIFSKHYFDLKGKSAEKLIHALALRTFLTDWCFLNPKLPNGKELYDLLVIFDNIAIIFQIKDKECIRYIFVRRRILG